MKKRSLYTVILILLLTTLACSSLNPGNLLSRVNPLQDAADQTSQEDDGEAEEDDQPEPTPQATSPYGPTPEVEPRPEANPLNLEMTLAAEKAVEAEIGPEGGTLETTGPGGTRFTLEIPAGALVGPETIRMTPTSSIEGLPLEDTPTYAVHLEPENLFFLEPAHLRIQPQEVDPQRLQVPFGTRHGGEDFHLQTGRQSDDGVEIIVPHFSEAGMMDIAEQAEVDRLRKSYTPSRADTYARDQIVVEMNITEGTEAELDLIAKSFRQWYYSSVLTRLQNAAVFDDRIDTAVAEYLAWEEWITTFDLVYGLDGEFKARFEEEIERAKDAIAYALVNGFETAQYRCGNENKPEEAFRMFRYGLIARHLDLWGRNGLIKRQAGMHLATCFNFEVTFRSKMEGISQDDRNKVSQVKAKIPIELRQNEEISYNDVQIIESGEVVFEVNTLTPMEEGCRIYDKSGTMHLETWFYTNMWLDDPPIGRVQTIFHFQPRPAEIIDCQGRRSEFHYWWGVFVTANQDFVVDDGIGFDLQILRDGDLIALHEYEGPVENVPETKETTSISVRHTP